MLRETAPFQLSGRPLTNDGRNGLPPAPSEVSNCNTPCCIGVWHSMQCAIVARYAPRRTLSVRSRSVKPRSASAKASRLTGIR